MDAQAVDADVRVLLLRVLHGAPCPGRDDLLRHVAAVRVTQRLPSPRHVQVGT